jgi:uncharacterized heparinase superfamily protein
MPRKLKYFQSFDAFIQLIFILRQITRKFYYRFFRREIQKDIEKFGRKAIENQLFLSGINSLISLPNKLTLNSEDAVLSIGEADRLLQNIYNLLGSGDKVLDPMDWHTDFKTGFRWAPGTFYKDYKQEGIDTNFDVKVPRELSRCHHFLKLALSYQLTKDEKYAGLCIRQMENWIQENPLMLSINWGCTMDVAIRAINWIWALRLISGSLSLTDESVTGIKSSLYEHGWFIYRNPEKNTFNNHNHYLSDLVGQIHLGLIFQQLPEPKKWLDEGIGELYREMRMQILPTGMSYERSTNYHRLVLELLLVPILLLKRNGHEIPSDIWYRLEKMFEFIMFTLKPNGITPIIGDQDDARLLPFGCEKNTDYRYLLSLGSILFDRADFKKQGDGYNIYCAILGGENSKEKHEVLTEHTSGLTSVSFPDSGFFIMRKEDNYFLFNASGKSRYAEMLSGTHTHSDLLSFELYTQGKSFLIDPGSYVYTADAAQRKLFRSTQMHNTVAIDGESQNIIHKEVLWDFERNAIPEVIKWSSSELNDSIVARHNGYMRLKQPVSHQRTINFDKQNIIWLIKDELAGKGVHLFEWFFHFDTGIDFSINNNEIKTLCGDGKNILIRMTGNDKIQARKEKSYVSKAYGEKEESFTLILAINSECPVELNIEIRPITENETNI